MDQRALAITVLVGELMQHQALARREADAKIPFLPVDLPAIDLEARALRLFDMQRLDVGARIFDFMRAVIPLLARDRHDRIGVREVDDLAGDQVDHGHHALDRMGVAVVLQMFAEKADGAHDTGAALVLKIEEARGERIDLDQLDILVGEPAADHRRAPAWIGLHHGLALGKFFQHHRRLPIGRLAVRNDLARDDLVAVEIDDVLDRLARGDVERQREGAAPCSARSQFLFGRLLQPDGREAAVLRRGRGGTNQRAGGRDLFGCQGIERMRCGRLNR
ncbi:hypothetical protein ACVIU4_005073 [Bradyrhizobium barranii subsp. barranii]|nr:hypothetical protein [Bradyrhizobium japonicum]MCP1957268.1 hypothetical protein [Bradyrhizobium japonicum]